MASHTAQEPTVTTAHPTHPDALSLLPRNFRETRPAPQILAQGAEALVFRTHFLTPSRPCVLKYRPPKKWRHPILDARLTRQRILAEARILARSRREGVPVPAILALDWQGAKHEEGLATGGWMMVEWIEGSTVRAALDRFVKWTKERQEEEEVAAQKRALLELMAKIGKVIGKLHEVGLTHGDLTTSNLMLRAPEKSEANGESTEHEHRHTLDGDIVLIDFGLAAQTNTEEDRGVDLYVLERAFGSTHPTIEEYFEEVLKAYGEGFKGAKKALKKLDEVRMRGRKKSMIG